MIVPGTVSHWSYGNATWQSCLPVSLTGPPRDWVFTPAQVLENAKMWDVLLTHKNTSLSEFFIAAVVTCTERNSRSRAKALKVLKAEDALNLPFREVFDLLRGKAEWCHFSCFTLAPRGQNAEWCDLGIAHGAPEETSEVSLMKYGWSKMLLKTDRPASQTKQNKKIGLIINCGEIRNLGESPRNSQLKHASVLSRLCRVTQFTCLGSLERMSRRN